MHPACADFKCPIDPAFAAAKARADKQRAAEMKRKAAEELRRAREAAIRAKEEANAKRLAEVERKKQAVLAAQ